MKKLLCFALVLLATGSSLFAQVPVPIVAGVVTADVGRNSNFKIIVSQTVSSVVLSSSTSIPGGQQVTLFFTENATGGFGVTFGGNISNPCTVSVTANATTNCAFQYDSTSNTWFGTSGSGSGSTAALITGNITTAGANCNVATSCVSVALPAGTQRAAITLSGQFAATLAFELSGDSGLTWFQAPSSSSANGTTTISVVADTNVRVRASAFTSGPVTVAIYPSSAGSEVSPTFTGPIAANGPTSTSGQDCIYGGGSGFACLGAPLNAGDPAPLLLPPTTAPANGTFGPVSDGNPAGQNLSWAPVAGLATTPVNSATIASDTFVRANGALGANWTAESDAADTGTLTITSNSVASGTNARAASFWSGAGVFTNDQWSQVTINGAATNSYIGPGVRMSAGGNYFECVSAIGANGPLTLFGIYEVLGGTVPVLLGGGMYGGPVATGAVLKLVAKGNGGPGTANPASLTCFLNGTQVAQIYGITDLPTGSPGIVDDSGNANNMTAWSGGNQASCTKGQWAYDSGFMYVCNATDVWVRTALSTF